MAETKFSIKSPHQGAKNREGTSETLAPFVIEIVVLHPLSLGEGAGG